MKKKKQPERGMSNRNMSIRQQAIVKGVNRELKSGSVDISEHWIQKKANVSSTSFCLQPTDASWSKNCAACWVYCSSGSHMISYVYKCNILCLARKVTSLETTVKQKIPTVWTFCEKQQPGFLFCISMKNTCSLIQFPAHIMFPWVTSVLKDILQLPQLGSTRRTAHKDTGGRVVFWKLKPTTLLIRDLSQTIINYEEYN